MTCQNLPATTSVVGVIFLIVSTYMYVSRWEKKSRLTVAHITGLPCIKDCLKAFIFQHGCTRVQGSCPYCWLLQEDFDTSQMFCKAGKVVYNILYKQLCA